MARGADVALRGALRREPVLDRERVLHHDRVAAERRAVQLQARLDLAHMIHLDIAHADALARALVRDKAHVYHGACLREELEDIELARARVQLPNHDRAVVLFGESDQVRLVVVVRVDSLALLLAGLLVGLLAGLLAIGGQVGGHGRLIRSHLIGTSRGSLGPAHRRRWRTQLRRRRWRRTQLLLRWWRRRRRL